MNMKQIILTLMIVVAGWSVAMGQNGTISPADTIVCSGTSATLKLSGHSGTVQCWMASTDDGSGWTTVHDGNHTSYTATDLQIETWYRVRMLNNTYSSIAKVKVKPTPTLTSIKELVVCSGDTLSYEITSELESTKSEWKRMMNLPNGLETITGDIYSTPGTEKNIVCAYKNPTETPLDVEYYITLTGANLCTRTETVTITIYAELTIKTHPRDTLICKGSTPSPLKIEAIGGNKPYSYKWYESTDKLTWNPVGDDSDVYPPPPLYDTTYYYCEVISASDCGVRISDTATIWVMAEDDKMEVISLSSETQTICNGSRPDTLHFKVTYAPNQKWKWHKKEKNTQGQWQWRPVPDNEGNSEIYLPPALTDTTYYRCVVTASGCIEDIIISDSIAIYVLEKFKIIQTSKNAEICRNEQPAPIGIEVAGGQDLIYRWYYRNSNNDDWKLVTDGEDYETPTYQPPSLDKETQYRCMVTYSEPYSHCDTQWSDHIRIDIIPSQVVNVSDIELALKQNNGETYMLIFPNPSYEPGFSYQWYEGDEEIANATLQFYYPPNYPLYNGHQRKLIEGNEYKVLVYKEDPRCGSYTLSYTHVVPPPEPSTLFTIHPNPAPSGSFTVSFNRDLLQDGQNYSLCIYSLMSEKIWEQKVNSLDNITITKNISAGIYMITLHTDEQQYTEKLLIK